MKKAEGMMLGSIAVNNTEQGAKEGQHGIRVKVWNGQPATQPSSVWFRSPKDARAAFKEQVERLDGPERRPILARISLTEYGQVTDERFIAQTPPTNYQ
ncbi:MAG: hypothetical protein M3Q60_09750 [Actinomycetota bacterium]|nr:hypothetical protein [Actinomycetota bacterium]